MSDAKKNQSTKAPSELRGVEVSLIRYGRAPSTAQKAAVGQTVLWAYLEGKQGDDDVRLMTMHDNAAGLVDELRLVLSEQSSLPLHFADVRPGHEAKHEFGDTKFIIDVFGVIEKKSDSGVIHRFASHAPTGASVELEAARAAYAAALRNAYANITPTLSAEEETQIDIVTDMLDLDVSDIAGDEAATEVTDAATTEPATQEAVDEAPVDEPAAQEPAADETPAEPEAAATEVATDEAPAAEEPQQEVTETTEAAAVEETTAAPEEAAPEEAAAESAPEETDQTFGNEAETAADFTEKDLGLNDEQKASEELPPEQTIDTQSKGSTVEAPALQARARRPRRDLMSPEEAASQLDTAMNGVAPKQEATTPAEAEKPAETQAAAPVEDEKPAETRAAEPEKAADETPAKDDAPAATTEESKPADEQPQFTRRKRAPAPVPF